MIAKITLQVVANNDKAIASFNRFGAKPREIIIEGETPVELCGNLIKSLSSPITVCYGQKDSSSEIVFTT